MFSINHIIYTNILGTAGHPYQFRNSGNTPQSSSWTPAKGQPDMQVFLRIVWGLLCEFFFAHTFPAAVQSIILNARTTFKIALVKVY